MANISTAVTVDKAEICSANGDLSALRKRSMIPTSKRFSIASHVKPHPLLHGKIIALRNVFISRNTLKILFCAIIN